MKLLIILFLSICVYVSSDQKIEGYYCEPSDEACMKAWTKCRGLKKLATGKNKYDVLPRNFYGSFMEIANECLLKHFEKPIGTTNPDEDPHGGAPGSPEQFHGKLQLRLKKIAKPETVLKIKCCYAEKANFVMDKKKINEKTFSNLINKRFGNETQVLQSHMNALKTCKTTPIKDCNLVPFRDCMYKTCIAEVRKQPK
ncbi:UNVERIFIED_CONTAM: hypothetical protein RMT77_001462 [Armadillidium vulgare]